MSSVVGSPHPRCSEHTKRSTLPCMAELAARSEIAKAAACALEESRTKRNERGR